MQYLLGTSSSPPVPAPRR